MPLSFKQYAVDTVCISTKNDEEINNNNSRTGSISNNNIKKNYREYKK